MATSKIRVGFIGVGNRGSQLLDLFMLQPDVEVAALCDVYEPYLQRDRAAVHPRFLKAGIPVPAMTERFPNSVARYRDFRELLARPDIDAVCIATPDHWHALQTIMAFRAGKDVFVEKPLTATIREGRLMVEAQRISGRIGAVGLNRRGSTVFRRLVEKVRGGVLGPVSTGCAYRISNMYPDGIGRCQAEPPPPGLDWELWLGPRASIPYRYNIAPYSFRWWQDYSSQMGNWGVHYLDAIRWLLNERAPVAVWAHGGKLVLNDDRTIPDTMTAGFRFASGTLVEFHIQEASGGEGIRGGDIELRGSKATLTASENGYSIVPARPGQFQTWKQLAEPDRVELTGDQRYGDLQTKEDTTANLIRNFLDCVRTRQAPLCPLEEGHRSTCFAHLANIALRLGRELEWDPERECFINCPEANAHLHYDYRAPWQQALHG